MKYISNDTFAIVDVETTGSGPVSDRILEIGILRVEGGKIVETYQTLFNPSHYIPPSITAITGIGPADVEGAPQFEDEAEKISKLLEGAIFVAHNVRFDYAFVKNELKRAGFKYSAKCLCTVRLSRALYPRYRHHNLSALIERHKLACENRHRAFDDAHVIWQFLQKVHKAKGAALPETIARLTARSSMPRFLDEGTVRALPEGPGVYLFYGAENELLYVGKSRNVRYRVLSHFSSDHTGKKELLISQHVTRVEARETAGELSALLLESELVKSLEPLYNRQLRKRERLVIARHAEGGPYPQLSLEWADEIDVRDYASVWGMFKNMTQAKSYLSSVAKETGLCPRYLGIEKAGLRGNGPCFSHQIGLCKGACAGVQDREEFETALKEAMRGRRIKAWPYEGAVMIEERVDDTERHSFILDNWCLIATAYTEEDSYELKLMNPRFEYDSYKIFARYIRNPQNRKAIRPFPKRELQKLLAAEGSNNIV